MKAKLLLLPILIATGANADVLMPTENSAKYADNRVRLTAKLQEPPKTILPKLVSADSKVLAETANSPDRDVNRAKTIVITADKTAIPVNSAKAIGLDEKQVPVNSAIAVGLDEKQVPVAPIKKTAADLPLRELHETIEISFRDRSLPSAIRSLTPPGWVVDLQIDESTERSLVNFSGESSYLQALKDILEPQGLTFLAYRNMKPKPLIVVTHGGKK